MSVFIIGEVGINHNGDLALAKKLIDIAADAGCDAVKFQKRTIEKVYSKEMLDSPRESPWGHTQREQKEGLEFGKSDYDVIDAYCHEKGMAWSASAWDVDSQRFLQQYDLCFNKVASAMLTQDDLLQTIAAEKRHTYISTGMSTMAEIDHAVDIFRKYDCPFTLMHCNSTYPMAETDANLRMISTLKERYQCEVGYSGHETGILVSLLAVAAGATSIERHITLDRSMYGSDQKASIEPNELKELVQKIRLTEAIMGTGNKILSDAELAVRKKLRG
nr:N-acetylneuraminate synthase family protein [uncultured Agathobaculum sp.]